MSALGIGLGFQGIRRPLGQTLYCHRQLLHPWFQCTFRELQKFSTRLVSSAQHLPTSSADSRFFHDDRKGELFATKLLLARLRGCDSRTAPTQGCLSSSFVNPRLTGIFITRLTGVGLFFASPQNSGSLVRFTKFKRRSVDLQILSRET